MGRIRTIKPEFFTSPDTAKASVDARLFYIAMWCWADDYGIGETNFNMLLGFAFPDEDQRTSKEVQSLCKEVADAYGTVFYTVRGRHYYAIPSWDDHQRTQRRAQRRNPTPDDPESALDQRIHDTQGTSEQLQGSSERTQGKSPSGTGEQGNRGTGEQGNSSNAQPQAVERAHPTRFDEFWDNYPRKVGKDKARTAYASACKRADEETVIAGVIKFANDPNLPEKQFIPHPTTWLNRGGWDDEPLPPRTDGRGPTRLEQNMAIAQRMWEQEQEQTPRMEIEQ